MALRERGHFYDQKTLPSILIHIFPFFVRATESMTSPFGTPRYVMVSDRREATIVSNQTNAALRVTYCVYRVTTLPSWRRYRPPCATLDLTENVMPEERCIQE